MTSAVASAATEGAPRPVAPSWPSRPPRTNRPGVLVVVTTPRDAYFPFGSSKRWVTSFEAPAPDDPAPAVMPVAPAAAAALAAAKPRAAAADSKWAWTSDRARPEPYPTMAAAAPAGSSSSTSTSTALKRVDIHPGVSSTCRSSLPAWGVRTLPPSSATDAAAAAAAAAAEAEAAAIAEYERTAAAVQRVAQLAAVAQTHGDVVLSSANAVWRIASRTVRAGAANSPQLDRHWTLSYVAPAAAPALVAPAAPAPPAPAAGASAAAAGASEAATVSAAAVAPVAAATTAAAERVVLNAFESALVDRSTRSLVRHGNALAFDATSDWIRTVLVVRGTNGGRLVLPTTVAAVRASRALVCGGPLAPHAAGFAALPLELVVLVASYCVPIAASVPDWLPLPDRARMSVAERAAADAAVDDY